MTTSEYTGCKYQVSISDSQTAGQSVGNPITHIALSVLYLESYISASYAMLPQLVSIRHTPFLSSLVFLLWHINAVCLLFVISRDQRKRRITVHG